MRRLRAPSSLLAARRPLPPSSRIPTRPRQPGAGPLTLQPALRPPVADTGIFSPLALPAAERDPPRRRRAGAAVLAAAGGLHASRRRSTPPPSGSTATETDPLHQQLARHAAVRVDAGGPESVPAGQHRVAAFASESRFGGRRVPGRIRDRRASTQSASPRRPNAGESTRRSRQRRRDGAPLEHRVDDTMMYVELAAAARAGRDDGVRRGVQLQHPGARRRPDGPRRQPVRDRPVVPADGGVRRRARLEHRPVPGPGRVLSGVRRHRLRGDRARRLHRGGQRRAAEPGAGADAATQRARLAAAVKSDSTMAIVTAEELASGAARPRRDGTLTWRFRAESGAGRGVGRIARLPVGRVGVGRRAGPGVLPARAPWRPGRTRPR